jgi:hypothetical protein
MAVVKVPKTPKASFDRNRRPSALLLDQISHLEWAVLPAAQRSSGQLKTPKVKTEGQAAERIAQLTAMVLNASTAAASVKSRSVASAPFEPIVLPPLPKMPRAPRVSKKRTTKQRAPKKRAVVARAAVRQGRNAVKKTVPAPAAQRQRTAVRRPRAKR